LTNRPLKKHVAAIHTDGHLSLLQRKLSNVLLLNAYDALLTQTEHEIDEKTLCVMLGYDSNDRKPLKESLKALASVHAEWNILGDNQEEVEWGVSSLLSHAILSRGKCRYGYSPALAEKLYNPVTPALIWLFSESFVPNMRSRFMRIATGLKRSVRRDGGRSKPSAD